ncbi:MAG: hypothetical protein M3Z54_09455 [Gemmatimonadota bacterium]|nr:hypothetical protein [Gemmatimonadota bacterium]
MIATPHTLTALRERWLARRDELHRLGALVHGARLCDELLADLEAATSHADAELLSLRRAAAESGYSADHLGRLLRAGTVANAGRPNAPRIRRGDLPRKASALPPPVALRTIPVPKRQIARACVTHSNDEVRDG